MIIINNTDLKEFKRYADKYLKIDILGDNCYKIEEHQANKQLWQLRFNKSLNEWILFNLKENFNIIFTINKCCIIIYRVNTMNRCYSSNRYFKKYNQLMLMIGSLFLLKRIKEV